MLKLTKYERSVLNGDNGLLQKVAMKNIVRYAEVLGAEELCEITKATVFCGCHEYLDVINSDDFHEIFTKLNLCKDDIINFNNTYSNCHVQSCVAPCDQYEYKPFNQSKEFFEKNSYFLEEANKAGVIISGTCAPYLTGWIPINGEHFVTTESGVTIIGNSLWGAYCNADGIEAAFWSAICGRTPKWGYHVKENRYGTHLINVKATIDSVIEWELLGKAIGNKLQTNSKPVVVGDFKNVDFVKLKHFFTALSIASNCRLCHIVGITPEARTVEDAFNGHEIKGNFTVTDIDIANVYEKLCDKEERKLDLVSLGCPHYDINQIKNVANYLKGKKIHKNVTFMLWTVYPIKCMADLNKYTEIIEEAGGHIYTSSCPTTIGDKLLKKYKTQLYDSLKQSGSVRSSELKNNIYYTDMYRCIDAAISGRWEEKYRWKK